MSRRKRRSTRMPSLVDESMLKNDTTFIDYFQQLTELALNVFEWINLPDTVDERYMEYNLYYKGYCLYFRDEIIGDLCLPCTIGGELDVYTIPILRQAFAVNGYQKFCGPTDSVIIFNNYLHTSTAYTIERFCLRLAEIQRTIDVNVRAQKTPTLISCTEQQRLTLENVYMQFDGNKPLIMVSSDFDANLLKCLKTDAPYVGDKLMILKHQVWNEALTFLGIENSNEDKRERLVASEVGSNYGNVEAQRNVMLNSRKQACKKINELFGTNIDVRFRSNLESRVNAAFNPDMQETETVKEFEEGEAANE